MSRNCKNFFFIQVSVFFFCLARLQLAVLFFRKITGHPEGNVYAAAFTPCDFFMVTGSGLGDLRVWDLSSFQVIIFIHVLDEFNKAVVVLSYNVPSFVILYFII